MKKNKEKGTKSELLRHSTAHVLAAAVLELFGKTKFGMGPAIDFGFYYDFETPRPLSPDDLPTIEKKIRELIGRNIPFEKKTISILEAKELFAKENQTYKVELINDLEEAGEKTVTVYATGQFTDLCRGPHLESTGEIPAEGIRLDRLAGAYWKGSEANPMLQRIYGLAFGTKKELKEHLYLLEEAAKRDHGKIGREQELFANFPEIGQGLPVWLPKGYVMRRVLEDYMLKMERSYGYEHILTPHINRKELFETSGHWDFYNESMYPTLEVGQSLKESQEGKKVVAKETFVLKPMNCPAGMMVYKMKPRSYRELPMKIGELGTVYRYEKSGELHGLQRVRGFTQNDAHIYATPEQLEDQFTEVLTMLLGFYKDLGFNNYRFRISLSDPKSNKYVGKREDWEKTENTLRHVLTKNKLNFFEVEGEAAFYGPKLDVQAVNVFGKEDSISTIQVDFNLPEKFDLTYIDQDGAKKRPFVIHRALVGSFERFFAFLIEHYAGAFPLWLSPVQVRIIPVSQKFDAYAQKIASDLKKEEIRVEADISDESLGKRIRTAEKEKIPYMLIVGEKEVQEKTVTIRQRGEKKQETIKITELLPLIQKAIDAKK